MKRLGWTLLDCVLFLCLWGAAPWLLGGCGDAGDSDPCGGKCKAGEQCTISPMTEPGCGLLGKDCTRYYRTCARRVSEVVVSEEEAR